MASLPLTKLVHEGVIVDISDVVDDWSIITPKHITDRMEVKRGDIVILHTGYHRYYEGKPQQDLTRYFCLHPGGTRELAQWMHDMAISWWGIDAGSGDHPMNTTIRYMRPDLAQRFEETMGRSVRDFFGEYEYRHHKSGRLVKEEIFPMHYLAFPEGCIHAENVGGDIEKVLNTRCIIGAFPWKFEGGEACPCRIIAFLDVGPLSVEEVQEAVGTKSKLKSPASAGGARGAGSGGRAGRRSSAPAGPHRSAR
ncbi:MAG: hypothetical protein AUG80_21260 [Candidatus Rokubacteria bacterium 13_1_20CM_4_68_9]|nr:MAG: hypothetical protein AUG80_21260 [Candidatus Rokubacteria bacterium 13_1_20CM_4_68_9]